MPRNNSRAEGEEKEAEVIAEHYNKIPSVGSQVRKASAIINIRNTNNFIKAKLIGEHVKKGQALLDLGCGKGGDLTKLERAGVAKYHGFDIAGRSIEEANRRAGRVSFQHKIEVFDVYNRELRLEERVDVAMSQFSFHYSFLRAETLKTALSNVSQNLKKGGVFFLTIPNAEALVRRLKKYGNNFGNRFYRVNFLSANDPSGAAEVETMYRNGLFGATYTFLLKEAVEECPEYLLNEGVLIREAEAHGLVLVKNEIFLDLLNQYIRKDKPLHARMVGCKISTEELAVVELYRAMVFVKE